MIGLRGRTPPVRDMILAAALVVYAVTVTSGDRLAAHPWAEFAAAAMAGSTLVRTTAPLAMAGVAGIGAVAFGLLPNPVTSLWAFLAILVVSFSIGANLGGRRRWVALVALLGGAYVLQVASLGRAALGDAALPQVIVTPLVLVGAPALAGGLLRRSREQTAGLRRLSAELAQERERYAELAVVAERLRIARELHDVIAHSVTGMVVQAGAAEQLADDPAVRRQVHGIRQSGKEALGELRQQLGLLREGAPGSPDALPGLARVGELVASSGATLDLEGASLEGPGALRLSPGLELNIYRVIQEALTNARRHAPAASVSVRLRRDGSALRITVTDDGTGTTLSAAGAGFGLIGMQERVEMYGGSVDAGPRTDSPGWQVLVRLPYAVDAAIGPTA